MNPQTKCEKFYCNTVEKVWSKLYCAPNQPIDMAWFVTQTRFDICRAVRSLVLEIAAIS
jgi:hypothetical protein